MDSDLVLGLEFETCHWDVREHGEMAVIEKWQLLFMTGTVLLTHDLDMKQVQGGHSNTLFELQMACLTKEVWEATKYLLLP